MNLQKVKEAREAIGKSKQKLFDLCSGKERWHMSIPADQKNDPDIVIMEGLRLAEEYLAELEAENPEEDELDCACDVFDCIKIEDDGVEAYPVADIEKGAILIQQYANSYHAKKCAECEAEKELKSAWSEVKKAQNKVAELQGLTPPYDLPDAENRLEEKYKEIT